MLIFINAADIVTVQLPCIGRQFSRPAERENKQSSNAQKAAFLLVLSANKKQLFEKWLKADGKTSAKQSKFLRQNVFCVFVLDVNDDIYFLLR